jgi:hypothetical protein
VYLEITVKSSKGSMLAFRESSATLWLVRTA